MKANEHDTDMTDAVREVLYGPNWRERLANWDTPNRFKVIEHPGGRRKIVYDGPLPLTFDLSSVPEGATIESATLTITERETDE